MRKQIFLTVLAALLFWACEKNDNTVFMHSYIHEYVDNELSLYPYDDPMSGTVKQYLYGRILPYREDGKNVVYTAPELGLAGGDAERFIAISKRNGDWSYDRYVNLLVAPSPVCCADNFKEIHVKCLNATWDQSHPAGSLLDDIAWIEYVSYADYIRNGYPEGEQAAKLFRNKFDKLNDKDLTMIDTQFAIYFSAVPAIGQYEMEVTLVTTDGVEKTAACTLVIE